MYLLCDKCGKSFRFIGGEGAGRLVMSGVTTSCTNPDCRAIVRVPNATIDYAAGIVRVLSASDADRATILRFQEIAAAVQAGEIAPDEAEHLIAVLGSQFLDLWRWVNSNAGGLTALLAVLTLYVAIMAKQSADAGSDQAHKDAMANQVVMEQILHELRPPSDAPQPVEASPPPKFDKI